MSFHDGRKRNRVAYNRSALVTTARARSLFDNRVSGKLEGLRVDRMPRLIIQPCEGWMDAISNLCARTATADGPSVRRRRPLSPAFKPLVPELLLNVDESTIGVALDLYEAR